MPRCPTGFFCFSDVHVACGSLLGGAVNWRALTWVPESAGVCSKHGLVPCLPGPALAGSARSLGLQPKLQVSTEVAD